MEATKGFSSRIRLIFLGVLISLVLVLYKMGIMNYTNLEYVEAHIGAAKAYVSAHYWYAIAIYIGVFSFGVACSLPLGVLVPILGGMLLGWIPGALCSVISATIGGTAAFLTSRYLLGDLVQARFGDRLAKFNAELDQYGYLYLLGLHFFPITPFFVLNIISGLTKIPLFTFFWTTVVGVFPAFTIYSYIGDHLSSLSQLKLAASAKIVAAFVLLKVLSALTLVVGRFSGKWFKKTSNT